MRSTRIKRGTGQLSERGTRRLPTWCAACAAEVEMATTLEAALIAGVSCYTIFHWAEADAIHHSSTPAGVLLLCPNSLRKAG